VDDGRPIRDFPDKYSVKAMGHTNTTESDDFAEYVCSVVESIVEAKDSISHKTRASSAGSYLSVTVDFTAKSQEELDEVFTVMNADERVVWVL